MNTRLPTVFDTLNAIEKQFFNTWDMIPKQVKSFLPYNVYQNKSKNDDRYVLELAVAGYTKENLDVQAKDGTIRISGKGDEPDTELNYLHKGLAQREFDFLFPFAPVYEVDEVILKDGLLKVFLTRNDEVIQKLDIKVA